MVFFQSMPSSTVQSSASPHLFSHFKAEALHCCLIKLWFLQGHQHTGSINSVDRHVPYFDLEKKSNHIARSNCKVHELRLILSCTLFDQHHSEVVSLSRSSRSRFKSVR